MHRLLIGIKLIGVRSLSTCVFGCIHKTEFHKELNIHKLFFKNVLECETPTRINTEAAFTFNRRPVILVVL